MAVVAGMMRMAVLRWREQQQGEVAFHAAEIDGGGVMMTDVRRPRLDGDGGAHSALSECGRLAADMLAVAHSSTHVRVGHWGGGPLGTARGTLRGLRWPDTETAARTARAGRTTGAADGRAAGTAEPLYYLRCRV